MRSAFRPNAKRCEHHPPRPRSLRQSRLDSHETVAYQYGKEWGWGTEDGEQALALLKRFQNATVLHGHIHQIVQKTDGNILLHTARSTAYPQPEAGKAAGPGPIKDVPPDRAAEHAGVDPR